jgi:hypothetical protein
MKDERKNTKYKRQKKSPLYRYTFIPNTQQPVNHSTNPPSQISFYFETNMLYTKNGLHKDASRR